ITTRSSTTNRSTLPLHDALPIWRRLRSQRIARDAVVLAAVQHGGDIFIWAILVRADVDDQVRIRPEFARQLRDQRVQRHPLFVRSEEHTSELQSRENLVCRLLLE